MLDVHWIRQELPGDSIQSDTLTVKRVVEKLKARGTTTVTTSMRTRSASDVESVAILLEFVHSELKVMVRVKVEKEVARSALLVSSGRNQHKKPHVRKALSVLKSGPRMARTINCEAKQSWIVVPRTM